MHEERGGCRPSLETGEGIQNAIQGKRCRVGFGPSTSTRLLICS